LRRGIQQCQLDRVAESYILKSEKGVRFVVSSATACSGQQRLAPPSQITNRALRFFVDLEEKW
jgi:hypothetical protein